MIAPITDRATFRALSRAGHHADANGLIGRALIGTDETVSNGSRRSAGPVRVGYAISRRVGNAVVRNRLRRRLRAIMEGLDRGPDGPIEPGAYLFIAKPDAARYTYAELGKQVESVMADLRDQARARS